MPGGSAGDCARTTQRCGTVNMAKPEAQVSRINSTASARTTAQATAQGRGAKQTRGGPSLAAIWIGSRPRVLAWSQSAGPGGSPTIPVTGLRVGAGPERKTKRPSEMTEPGARLFGRASESVTRGDRRKRELEFESPFPPLTARPNRRRDDGWDDWPSRRPSKGLRIGGKNQGKILTPVGHLFMTHSERRFAPTTVRQARNGVRHGLEQVSDIIGIRRQAELTRFLQVSQP